MQNQSFFISNIVNHLTCLIKNFPYFHLLNLLRFFLEFEIRVYVFFLKERTATRVSMKLFRVVSQCYIDRTIILCHREI